MHIVGLGPHFLIVSEVVLDLMLAVLKVVGPQVQLEIAQKSLELVFSALLADVRGLQLPETDVHQLALLELLEREVFVYDRFRKLIEHVRLRSPQRLDGRLDFNEVFLVFVVCLGDEADEVDVLQGNDDQHLLLHQFLIVHIERVLDFIRQLNLHIFFLLVLQLMEALDSLFDVRLLLIVNNLFRFGHDGRQLYHALRQGLVLLLNLQFLQFPPDRVQRILVCGRQVFAAEGHRGQIPLGSVSEKREPACQKHGKERKAIKCSESHEMRCVRHAIWEAVALSAYCFV